jgi:hypothetical protein
MNGRVAEKIWPLVTVKGVAVPIVAPAELTNDRLPVQEAAVPLDELAAIFTTLIWAVSELASPTGGK